MRSVSMSDLRANSDLLFCPFCGGEAHIKEVVSGIRTLYSVSCSDQSCMGFNIIHHSTTPGDATAAWNRRAERTCHVETKERRFSKTQTLVTKSCSACGHAFGSEEVRPILPGLDETMVLDPVDVPNYCPSCGARIERGDE